MSILEEIQKGEGHDLECKLVPNEAQTTGRSVPSCDPSHAPRYGRMKGQGRKRRREAAGEEV